MTTVPAILGGDDTSRVRATLEATANRISSGDAAPPGVVLAVSHAGGLEHCSAGNVQAFDDLRPLLAPAPFVPETRTDIGSVTKVMATTTALMRLVAAGELDLDRTLSEILPWTGRTPCSGATLTALLEHRAGLWEWWPLYLSAHRPESALQLAATLPLRDLPDHRRRYSDLGFQLLGAVVAHVAGLPLSDAVDELVLEPFGLRGSRYGRPAGGASVAASSTGDWIERRMIETGEPYPVDGDPDSFTGWRTHVLVGEVNDGNAFHAFGGVAGHAGMFSSTRDLLRFGDQLRQCLDGSGLIGGATVSRFLTAGADPMQGLGFRRWSTEHGDAWGHTGFPGVAVAIVPALEATAVMVTNRLHTTGTPRPTEPMWKLALGAACACAASEMG